MARPAQRIIDLSAIKHNYQIALQNSENNRAIAVVKANAYGHGAVAVAKALADLAPMYAVASSEEALQLRDAGIKQPILLLEGCFSLDEYHLAAQHGFQPVIHQHQQLEQLCSMAGLRPLPVWLKVDTGMHRLGVQPEDVERYLLQLEQCPLVKVIHMMTHFSCADEVDNPFTQQQLERFNKIVRQQDISADNVSAANSAAVLAWPQTRIGWTRPGIMLYGLTPFERSHRVADNLRPAMTFVSQVTALRKVKKGDTVGYGNHWQAPRDSLVATVAAGYGDGYPRHAPSGTPVLINGQSGALAGRVSMDMLCVDVTDLSSVGIGDRAELWGSQLAVNEVARWAGTIGYELVTRMPDRARLCWHQ